MAKRAVPQRAAKVVRKLANVTKEQIKSRSAPVKVSPKQTKNKKITKNGKKQAKNAKKTTKVNKKIAKSPKVTPSAHAKKTTVKVRLPPKQPKVLTPPLEPKKRVKKEAKVPTGPKGYTKQEYEKYKEQKVKIAKLNNAQMKAILKKNLQSMSGNKDEMIQKIVDGIVLGRIPRCPKCYGGRPKYDKNKGTYHCSGYRDDTEFKNCHTDFTKEQLKRDPWQN